MADKKKYRVTEEAVDITFPTSRKAIEKKKKGQPVTREELKLKTVKSGATTTQIPPESIPWLLEEGLIEEVKS